MIKLKLNFQRYSWLLLLLVGPLVLFPSPSFTPALLVIPLVVWVHRGRPSNTILDWPILLLAVMVLVSLYATYDIALSLPKIAGLLFGVAVYYAIARACQSLQSWNVGAAVFVAGGLGVALLGLLGTNWINKVSFLIPLLVKFPLRFTGLPGAEDGLHPNQVAGALLWVIPLLWVVVFALARLVLRPPRRIVSVRALARGTVAGNPTPPRRRWLWVGLWGCLLALAVLVLGTFILTQSRGGYVAAAATALVAFLIWLWHRGRRAFLGGLGLLVVVGGVLANYGWTAVFSGNEDGSLVSDPALSLDTLNGRLEIWSRALYGIQDFPFTGMGLNTFRHVVHVLYPLFLIGPDYDIAHAHNEFLQAALDLGLPGLIAFIALYLGSFWMLWKIWQAPAADQYLSNRFAALGLGGGLLAHLLYGLTDAVALGAKPGLLFWMLLGLIAALYRQTESKAAPLG